MLSVASRRLSLNLHHSFLHRHYTKLPKPIHQILSNVPSRHRRRAIREAQLALTDHLHTTRAIQFIYAERISKNSLFSLSNAISKIDFSVTNFAERFSRWLTYNPFDELDFFYESIGIDYKELRRFASSDGEVFISQDFRVFNVACVLCGLGFPWKRLGELYKNEVRVFEMDVGELGDRVLELRQCGGFKNAAVVGMCLACPELLLPRGECEVEFGNVGVVMDVLRSGNDRLKSCEKESLDFWYEFTGIVKVLRDISVEGGSLCSVMDRFRKVLEDYSVEGFVEKIGYFCKLGVEKRDVVMLILERPELVSLDLENHEFSVLGILKHFGMSDDEMKTVAKDFPYVLGRNKMENLPSAMRVMDLQNWFFDRLKNGSPALLVGCVVDDTEREANGFYIDGLEKMLTSGSAAETVNTLDILHGIGFGKNLSTLKMVDILKNYDTLEDRFDCFINFGADYSRLCRSVACWPSILRQDPYTLTEKLNFLITEMGLSWSYLYNHPECFDFDLDKRIKPRLKFYDWLAGKGLDTRSFSLCKKIKQRDEAFVAGVSYLHPAAPKHYFESFAFCPKVYAPLDHPDPPKLGCGILSNVPIRYHDQVIQDAQIALGYYLHSTQSMQVTYAEQISKNSICSLSNVISKLNFSVSTFTESFIDFLKCHPIDETDFFYESIGMDVKDIPFLSPSSKIFNIQDFNDFGVACVLYGLGFPWNRLGELYRCGIFSKKPEQLMDTVLCLKTYGFENVAIVGMCLTFPELFQMEFERGVVDLLLNDIKRVYELTNNVQQVLDSSYEVFRKMKMLYSIGFAAGEFFDLTDKSRSFFVDYLEDAIVKSIEYFCKLGVGRKDVALFLLSSPEVIGFDLATREFSVLGFLTYFGMSKMELESVIKKFPHVMGRNKMANMPSAMRALDLQNWFFDQIKNGRQELLGNYSSKKSTEDTDKYYEEGLNQIRLSKSRVRALTKLKFLHTIGFGENRLTMELLPRLGGHYAHLQQRFDCFIDIGANYSKICGVLLRVPTILNNDSDTIKAKVNYLFNEMRLTMSDLYKFPLFLESDLDKGINPRYRFYEWLIDKGLSAKPFSLVTLVTTKGTRFIGMIFRIHPAAPKHYLECFLYREI